MKVNGLKAALENKDSVNNIINIQVNFCDLKIK